MLPAEALPSLGTGPTGGGPSAHCGQGLEN